MSQSSPHLISVNQPNKPTLIDWTSVEDDIRRYDKGSREANFLALVLDHLFELRSGAARIWVTEGGNDRGIDAVVIDDNERRIHLINTKCVKSYEKSCHNFPSAEADKAITFLDELLHKRRSLNSCNPTLFAAVEEIWECMNKRHHTLR